MKRHPELSLRTAESTSSQRGVGFNRPQVSRFFEKLGELQTRYNFPASRIFNADETGVSCVHRNDTKVLSVKGKRQVGKLTSGERGRTITVLLCVNASGDQFLPPLFIFPRQRMNDRLMIDAPAGSLFVAHDSGWITADSFKKWLQEFVRRVHPTVEDPALLVLDGHSSHKELDVILFARNNHVHLLSLPPHTTHKLQPLDRAVMKPFKNAYNEACASWMRKNPFCRITDYEVAGLVNSAFTRICRMELAKKGFECTGIYPFNPNVFTELDYLPAEGLDISDLVYEEHKNDKDISKTSKNVPQVPKDQPPPEPLPSTSSTPGPSSQSSPSTPRCTISAIMKQISPVPAVAERRLNVRRRRAARSEILTSSPYKSELERKQALKECKQKKTQTPKTGVKKVSKKLKLYETGENDSQAETECIICGETFQEDWIKCDFCQGWAHENCANTETNNVFYKCDSCELKDKMDN